MYHSHFGLQESPFGITPNPAFFYAGNMRGEILDALLYAVIHGEGIIKLTGEVGSGKTMLCRMLESRLPPHIDVIYLSNPTLSHKDVAYAIAGELELEVGSKRIDEVIRILQADLIARHTAGRQVVLLVEEAQAMPLETLEEIRLFSNLETAHSKLLQIVLFGQPELDEHLALASMRQLKERITHSFNVPAMPPETIPDFLAFRLKQAGYDGPAVFSEGATRQIARVSRGIVRRINILADKALLAAFADDADCVEEHHARAAIRDSAFGRPPLLERRTLAAAAAALLLGGAVAWLVLRPSAPAIASAVSTAAPNSLLQQTAASTRTWLRDEPAGALTLVVTALPADKPRAIEDFLRSTRSAVGLQQVHAYPLRINGVDHVAVAYGSFATRADAEATRALLSQQWGFRAQIREVATVRSDVGQSGSADLW
ncbi:MAG: AAA family ATPase [Pseudomonadota bacterium]